MKNLQRKEIVSNICYWNEIKSSNVRTVCFSNWQRVIALTYFTISQDSNGFASFFL